MKHLAPEWQRVHLALRAAGLSPVVLGSFACLGFLGAGARSALWTDDLDFGFAASGRPTRGTVRTVMRDLGYRARGRGKWQGSTTEAVEIDLIAPGGAPEAGLELRTEWWLTWTLHGVTQYQVPANWLIHGTVDDVMLAPSPGAALLGKALKTAGYLARPDWPDNHRDVAHATKAAHDAALIMADVDVTRLASSLDRDAVRRAATGRPAALLSFEQARRCLVDLFGSRSARGYSLAAPVASANGTDLERAAQAGAALARTIARS